MYVVTGGAGFIGSHIVKALNAAGHADIIVVDDLTDGKKFRNLAGCQIADYQDYQDFLQDLLYDDEYSYPFKAVFHQGACSDTTEWNGRYMMRNNFEYSKSIFHYCVCAEIPFFYASSAAVYGQGKDFGEQQTRQTPLNVYGYSKWLFDQYVQNYSSRVESQVVGLRYFNVYGPGESHKKSMASVAFHWMNQLRDSGKIKLFAGSDGYADGEQLRDFVFVEDIAKVNLWLLDNPYVTGLFNVGTGKARTFNSVAKTLLKLNGSGELEYIPFPEHLKGSYQSFTQADISALREAGYKKPFCSLEEGLEKYYKSQATT